MDRTKSGLSFNKVAAIYFHNLLVHPPFLQVRYLAALFKKKLVYFDFLSLLLYSVVILHLDAIVYFFLYLSLVIISISLNFRYIALFSTCLILKSESSLIVFSFLILKLITYLIVPILNFLIISSLFQVRLLFFQ